VKYSPVTGFTVEEVMSCLEIIRSDTSRKDEGNKEFKETSVASLELHLPKEEGQVRDHAFRFTITQPLADLTLCLLFPSRKRKGKLI